MAKTVQAASLQLLQSFPLGLTTDEAQRRRAVFGANEPAAQKRASLLLQLLNSFANPLVLILLVASSVSAVLHDIASAIIIVVIVLSSILVNFAQTYRSQLSIDRLRSHVVLTATVCRDGRWQEIPRHDVVPGDLIRLSAGDLVPADARLLEAKDLHVQQSLLTGESLPVEKAARSVKLESIELSLEDSDAVFLGTSIVGGAASAVVIATGNKTVFGDITASISTKPPETEFERGIRRFSLLIMQTVIVLVLFIFLTSAVMHRDAFQSLLFGVALAVGLTPEFLPMIVSVTLARGAIRMAHKSVVIKHLPSMQNFGSMDILCSDKTGTLTIGEMRLDKSLDPHGQNCDRALHLAAVNSAFETGIKSPLDVAILQKHSIETRDYRKIDEIPFDFERRRVSVAVETGNQHLFITKGAPEAVLPICTAFEIAGSEQPWESSIQDACHQLITELGRQGFRLLAVAYRKIDLHDTYQRSDEHSFVLVGFLVFLDPPRQDAAAAIRALQRDGVAIKILTGDSELVAQHVCSQVGLENIHTIRGDDLDRVSDQALGHVAENTTIFGRLSPRQKCRVILALKSRGHCVGYLGDGVNDAPSLHAADVGISVNTAVDVARDAADVILLERSLRVLHAGILEGRRAFGNVMKYLFMGTSSNFGNMFSMAIATMFLPFLPMLPTQILLNNFLYDLAQLTIPTDNVDPSFLHKPRRWDIRLIRNFMLLVGPISSLFDFVTFAVLILVLHASEALFHTGWFVESLATQTLVLFVIRTAGNPLRSRPSHALTLTVLAVAILGLALPFTPMAAWLGFVRLPGVYYLFLSAATAGYLLAVQWVKTLVLSRYYRSSKIVRPLR